MLDGKEKEILGQGIRVVWVVWAAMLSSLGVYIFVCQRVAGRLPASRAADSLSTLRAVLFAAAVVELAVIPRLRRYMLKTGAGTTARSPMRAVGQPFHPAAARYMSATVVTLALAESIGIYGMLLFFLGIDPGTLYMFIGVSAGAMVYYRPRMEELERVAVTMKADPAAVKTGP